MSVWSDLKDGSRQIILLESRIDQLNGAVGRLADQSLDHKKRLIRIETMIEMARGRADSIPPKLSKD